MYAYTRAPLAFTHFLMIALRANNAVKTTNISNTTSNITAR
jgi:hypothetical protein